MIVPVQNIVETVDLTPKDALLPLFECIINSVISLMQSSQTNKEIQIKIIRGDLPKQISTDNIKTIQSIVISDNGVGFTNANFKSFETPFSKTHKEFGCKGIGRFTVLAAFSSMHISSNYLEGNTWKYREFKCDAENEVSPIKFEDSKEEIYKTKIELIDCFNSVIKDKTALSIESISQEIMHHCLIYYLSGQLPLIRIFDTDDNKGEIINDLFKRVSKEHERVFQVGSQSFKAYITKTLKESNRKNHYTYYCANSRVVGQ
ncbi:MAG: ATP-binding protein, partial [Chitinophagaceae bacterium]|nr:ATP-binding protein [Chitinophagaceae bacterium]